MGGSDDKRAGEPVDPRAGEFEELERDYEGIEVLRRQFEKSKEVYENPHNWTEHFPGSRYGTNDVSKDFFDPNEQDKGIYDTGKSAESELQHIANFNSDNDLKKAAREALGVVKSGCLTSLLVGIGLIGGSTVGLYELIEGIFY